MTNDDEPTTDPELTLEKRLGRLEEILGRMESDEVALEEALRLFEEGVAHVREAERVLAATELRVEELLASGQTRDISVDAGE
jgi:exodeoxyribonuclease VII small subunit